MAFQNLVLIVLVLIFAVIYSVNSGKSVANNAGKTYKILGLFPHPSRSHVAVFEPIMEALANRGHHVTVVSHYKQTKPIANYKEMVFGIIGEDLLGAVDMNFIQGYRLEKYLNAFLLAYFGQRTCRINYSSKVVQDLIKSDEQFDLIITEFFNSDCFLPFAHKFKAPVIGLSSCTTMPWINRRFANPNHPAYIPNNNMDYSDRLSFFQRVENTVSNVLHDFVFNWVIRALDDSWARQNFGSDVPPISQLVSNVSLLLVNSHFSATLPRPMAPAVVEVGGVHVRAPKKLPESPERLQTKTMPHVSTSRNEVFIDLIFTLVKQSFTAGTPMKW